MRRKHTVPVCGPALPYPRETAPAHLDGSPASNELIVPSPANVPQTLEKGNSHNKINYSLISCNSKWCGKHSLISFF